MLDEKHEHPTSGSDSLLSWDLKASAPQKPLHPTANRNIYNVQLSPSTMLGNAVNHAPQKKKKKKTRPLYSS